MTNRRTREFFVDRRNGMRSRDLMLKYHLSEERIEQILDMLRRSDLIALRRLWEQNKLTDAEFMRAFDEVENRLMDED
jgi:Mor family transcriptional regulator